MGGGENKNFRHHWFERDFEYFNKVRFSIMNHTANQSVHGYLQKNVMPVFEMDFCGFGAQCRKSISFKIKNTVFFIRVKWTNCLKTSKNVMLTLFVYFSRQPISKNLLPGT